MKVDMIKTHGEPVLNEPVCACIGYFDGLHRGHRALIDETIRRIIAAPMCRPKASAAACRVSPRTANRHPRP